MLLHYSGGIIFKTKNEKYIASNALVEINSLHYFCWHILAYLIMIS